MEEQKRFDKWPPIVPEVGRMVQIQLGVYVFETRVTNRGTRDMKTFIIKVDDPFNDGTKILLDITPTATGKGRVDGYSGNMPYWQTVPTTTGAERQAAKLFFL